MNLPRAALGNSTLVVIGVVSFVAWGLLNYGTIPRREDPEIKISMALVVTLYPGASAEKVEEQVTRKLEERIRTMANLESVDSTSRESLSVIFVKVRYDADADMEWQKLRSRVDEARADLPSTVIGPDVHDNFGDTASMIVCLSGAEPRVLADLARDLSADLRAVRSVGDVAIHGERPETIYLEGTRAALSRHGLTPLRIAEILGARNIKLPGGAIQAPPFRYRVQPTGAFRSLEEIEDTVLDVSAETGLPLHVRDIFAVRRGVPDPPETLVLHDGRPAVALSVVAQRGHNVMDMGEAVRGVLARFAAGLPAGARMDVVHDSSRQIDAQVWGFTRALLEGLGIVILVLAIAMGLRVAAISATAIPLSICITLAVMPLLRIDLEVVSISAFIVALGMLVDDSIIVSDAVDMKLREGLARGEAAWRGARDIAAPVVVGTLGTVVAFLPMLLLTEEVGAYARGLPIVVSVAMMGSLLVSQTVTPLMARTLLRSARRADRPFGQGPAARFYRRFLARCVRLRWLVLGLVVASLAGSGLLLSKVGFSFFPDAQRDQFTVDVWLDAGASIVETERVARLAESRLRADPEVRGTVAYVGEGGPRFYITVVPQFRQASYAQIMVNTRSPEATARVVERFNRMARSAFPGARVFARRLVMGMPVDAPIELRVAGSDLGDLKRTAGAIREILRSVPGADQIRDDAGPDLPSLVVDVDAERAARVGAANADVALALLSAYQGFELTRVSEGEREIPVVLRLADADRRVDNDLAELPVTSSVTGRTVALGTLADIRADWGPAVIRRHDGRRAITVMAWNRGRLASDIVEEAWPRIASIALPPGISIDVSGEKYEMDKAFRELVVVFAVIVASLLGILVLQFRSLRRAVVVLLVIPLSVIGASIGLFVGGFSFSFMAFLGVISLAGMAVKSSVLLVEYAERLRRAGRPLLEAVIEAGIQRMRPIALTQITTMGGLVPLALFGGVLFEPMAVAMIFGLGLATALTLVVTPICYVVVVGDRPPVAAGISDGLAP